MQLHGGQFRSKGICIGSFERDMYTDSERQIFAVKINGAEKSWDPIAVTRSIQSDDELDLEGDSTIVNMIDEKSPLDRQEVEALTRILKATREAFNLPEYVDGEGYLDEEVLRVFAEFFAYLDEVKKKE